PRRRVDHDHLRPRRRRVRRWAAQRFSSVTGRAATRGLPGVARPMLSAREGRLAGGNADAATVASPVVEPVEFRLLGPIEARSDGNALELGGPRQRAVLGLLLLEANRVVSADRLIDGVWGEQAPETAAGTLQSYVSRLRKVLGADVLRSAPPGY